MIDDEKKQKWRDFLAADREWAEKVKTMKKEWEEWDVERYEKRKLQAEREIKEHREYCDSVRKKKEAGD